MRIAVMQPYFVPYAGYFRLFAATDLVVLFDCVQFLRRGWIHRNRLPNSNNELQWLTLPLKKQPQDVLIKDLAFADDAGCEWEQRLNKFNHLFQKPSHNMALLDSIKHLPSQPVTFLEDSLRKTCEMLGLPFQTVNSSSLPISSESKGQDKILEICEHFNATDYINLAGGKELYDPSIFKNRGINLKFLSDYNGSYASILHRTMTEDTLTLGQDIKKQSEVDRL